MTLSVPAPVELPPAPVDVKAAMKDFLVEAASPEAAPATEAPSEAAQDAAAPVADPETAVEAKPPEAAPDKPTETVKSGYTRLKVKHEAAVAELADTKAKYREAVIVANDWHAEAKALKEHYSRILEQHKVQLDPRDAELFRVKRQAESQALAQKGTQLAQHEDQAAQLAQQKLAYQAEYTEQAEGLAAKHGLTQREILLAYATTLDAGHDIPMAQVAARLAAVTGKAPAANPQREQLAANRAAPKTLKPGRSVAPSYGTDKEGMKAYLSSIAGRP